jgi:histidinol dehydrogenase
MNAAALPTWRWPDDRDDDELRRRLDGPAGGIDADVARAADAIIADVAARGDEALLEATARFDRVTLTADRIRVDAATIEASASRIDPALALSLEQAVTNIERFHTAQRRGDTVLDADGLRVELRWSPVASVALYVPGGRAAYPSSLLMNAIPALVAGVPRVAVLTVPGTVEQNPAVAWCLRRLGLTEVYRVAGAQAVAAAAHGTASLPRVDLIVGPGNAYVAAAKRAVFGRVGIDSVAGPSEVVVVADATAPPEWIAADLLAQAEHDPMARCLLLTASPDVATAVGDEVARQLAAATRSDVAGAALRDWGAIVVVASIDDARALSNRIAPEHLQLMYAGADADGWVAGALFVGACAPTALGDYIAGPNHVLPTGGSARFSGPLRVDSFLRASSVVTPSPAAAARLAAAAAPIADAEGLSAHASALRARTGGAR